MSCAHCNDTGSLSKDLHGDLDCVFCETATERLTVEGWAAVKTPNVDSIDAWLLYRFGKRAVA